jgi:SAM-dependent methyltransferase
MDQGCAIVSAIDLTSRVLAWLNRERDARPPAIDERAWEYAVRYAEGRYRIGLAHYRKLFDELGWSARRRGLDIGSGAGHWAIAFALDNGEAAGIDKSEAFVHLANGAAVEAGLAGRVRHAPGRGEALDFPGRRFDAVWTHSVLMYCDTEDTISEVARVLEPGGQFYCGYSSTGFRLSAIYGAASSRQGPALKAQLGNYLGAALRRDGVARNSWSAIRCATVAELSEVCRAFGLRRLRCPGLQDGSPDFAGIPGTVDLLCVRGDEPHAFRAGLLDLSAASAAGGERYRELLRAGLGKLVYGVLKERGEALLDPETRSLYVLAGLCAGQAESVAALAEGGLDPLVRGLLAFDRGRLAEAVAGFRELPGDHPDRSFLLGAALLRAGETAAATTELERGAAAANHRPIDCEIGAMLSRLGAADWREQHDRLVRMLRALPKALGASPRQIERLVEKLAGRDPGPRPA